MTVQKKGRFCFLKRKDLVKFNPSCGGKLVSSNLRQVVEL